MKKLSIVLLAVLLVASLIISCDNSTKALTDELVEVQLGTQAGSRALSSSVTLEQISDSSLKWFYSASKETQQDFATGETERAFIRLGDTKTFSQGKWTFILWAEKGADVDENGNTTTVGKKVYEGKLEHVLITKSSSPVPVVVNVSPYVAGENGSLVFSGVKIKAATSTAESLVTVVPNTVKIGTNNYTLDASGNNSGISLAPGQYDVLVAFIGSDGVTYASETITVTIYSNRVTTLTGMVDEETASAEITVIGTAATVTKTVSASGTVEIKAPVNPAGAVSEDQSGTVKANDTVVSLPGGALTLSTGATNTAILKVDTTSIENSNFSVAAGESNLTSVAGLDITLKVNNADVKTFNNDKKATVTTYIARNLTNVEVRYNKADGSIEQFVVETTTSDTDITIPEGKAGVYYSKTGKLVFQTSHFSEYYVVANKFKVLNATQSKVYDNLSASILDCNDGDTIKLFENVSEEDNLTFTKDVIVDLNQKTLSISSRYANEIKADVTLKNGTINVSGYADNNGAISISSESNLIMDHVNYTSDGCGIIIDKQTYDASVSVIDSSITAEGYNAIGTNASIVNGKTSDNVRVTIKDSRITADMAEASDYPLDCVAVLFNVPGKVVVEDSTLKGDRQALILRGGEGHVVRNSTLEVVGTGEITADYLNSNWGSGNEVPLAALVIGNRSSSAYAYPTSVKLESVVLKAPENNSKGKAYFGLYVWQNSDSYPVSVSGTINAESTINKVNSNKNSADFRVGEMEEVYTISTASELFEFANNVNTIGNSYSRKTVLLTNDIDLNNVDWTPVGQTGATQFMGTFDGQGYTIKNLKINNTDAGGNCATGLFGWLNNAIVKNINIDTAEVSGHHNVGVIAGYMETNPGCTIENCNVSNATVSCTSVNTDADGDKCGGIVGHAGNGGAVVKSCTVTNSTISAGRDAGQVVGAALTANVTDCSATNVTVTANGTGYEGKKGQNINQAVIGRVL